MPNTRDVLIRTLELIQERGWEYEKYVNDGGRSLCVRAALGFVASVMSDDASSAYSSYLAGADAISAHIGTGVTYWEYGTKSRRRTQSEVEAMLTEVIARLETQDEVPTQSRGSRGDARGGAV